MADKFLTPRGVTVTVLLGDDPPKSDGMKLPELLPLLYYAALLPLIMIFLYHIHICH